MRRTTSDAGPDAGPVVSRDAIRCREYRTKKRVEEESLREVRWISTKVLDLRFRKSGRGGARPTAAGVSSGERRNRRTEDGEEIDGEKQKQTEEEIDAVFFFVVLQLAPGLDVTR